MKPRSYRKRYVRSRNPAPIRVTDEDLELLLQLNAYRFLSLPQVQALRPRGIVALRARLRKLFDVGLVHRPRPQRTYFSTPSPMVYSLSTEGLRLLIARGLLDTSSPASRNSEVGRLYLEHALMISHFRATLTMALRNSANPVQLVRWVPEGAALNYSFLAGGERRSVRPDAFFSLDAGKGFYHFAVEADRGQMTLSRFQEKLRSYWVGRQAYQERLGVAAFRVLTVTTSETRRDNLVRAARDLGEAGQSERFLFACEKDYSLETPQSILGPIWRCPRDGGPRSIINE